MFSQNNFDNILIMNHNNIVFLNIYFSKTNIIFKAYMCTGIFI